MIYLTGDTHGGPDTKKLVSRKVTDRLTADDTLIICGDFGFIWDTKKETGKEKTWLKWFEERPWTTVFVDGNHECFPRLASYPEVEWNGGKAHQIRSHLYHLERGEIFEIEGQRFFAMGGAASHDRGPAVGNTKSVEGKYWWPEEIPSEEERQHGLDNLAKYNNEVDYIITHCLPSDLQYRVKDGAFPSDDLTNYFETLENTIKFKHWYCGHYHMDRDVTDTITILFNKILKLGECVVGSEPIAGSPIYLKRQGVKFLENDVETFGIIQNIYPWGWGVAKQNAQPVYDIIVSDGSGRIVKFVGENQITGVLK